VALRILEGAAAMRLNYHSIFKVGTPAERERNFQTYYDFTRAHSGDILEQEQDLTRKRDTLSAFQNAPVRARKPIAEADAFYRNYVNMVDNPATLERKTLFLTCMYKFARHEWVGISGAWDATPTIALSKDLLDRISRYHLAEEFCHIRLFHEMFRTVNLDQVQWQPLGPFMGRVYRIFPYLPGFLMDAPAFVTELMGIVFYRHMDAQLDDIFADEPEARDRLRALLHEIMVDELAHVGQRRNFFGPVGTWFARLIVGPLMRAFFHDIPESRFVFDVDQMIRDAHAFDYTLVSPEMVARSWVPTYCTPAAAA
jgi:hypothetical protein